jgi:hypothetical protein
MAKPITWEALKKLALIRRPRGVPSETRVYKCTKVPRSKLAAERAVRRDRTRHPKSTLGFYWCRECKAWHIGHHS